MERERVRYLESRDRPHPEIIDSGYRPYIEIPSSPNLKLIVVVSVYQEYKNGHIFRLIETFCDQLKVDRGSFNGQFEIIVVVNNRIEEREQATDSYQDNQATLQLGRYINGAIKTMPDGLNEHCRKILDNAKEVKLPVHMIDLTGGVERNMGAIRDIGVQEAIHRFKTHTIAKERGIIAQLDADTIVSSRYVENVIQRFDRGDINSLFFSAEGVIPEGEEQLFRTSYAYQLWYEKMFFDSLVRSDFEVTDIGGPRTAATVAAYEKIGGVSHSAASNEDFELTRSLRDMGGYDYTTNARVYIADRAREAGFDGKARSMHEGDFILREQHNPRLDLLIGVLGDAYVLDSTILNDEQRLERIFKRFGVLFKKDVLDEVRKEIEREEAETIAKNDLGLPTWAFGNEEDDISKRTKVRDVMTRYGEKEGISRFLPLRNAIDETISLIANNILNEKWFSDASSYMIY